MKNERTSQTVAAISDGQARKPYSRPVLVEYGSVAKLTQGSGLTGGDGGSQALP